MDEPTSETGNSTPTRASTRTIPATKKLRTAVAAVAALIAVAVLTAVVLGGRTGGTGGTDVTNADLNLDNAPSGELIFYSTLNVNGLDTINNSVTGAYDATAKVASINEYPNLTGQIELPEGYNRYVWAGDRQLVKPMGNYIPTGLGDRWLIVDNVSNVPTVVPGMPALAELRDREPETWDSIVASLRNEGTSAVPVTGQPATLYRAKLPYSEAILLARTSMPFVSASFSALEARTAGKYQTLAGSELEAAMNAELAKLDTWLEIWSENGKPVAMRVSVDPTSFDSKLMRFSVTGVTVNPGTAQKIPLPDDSKVISVSDFTFEQTGTRPTGIIQAPATEIPFPAP